MSKKILSVMLALMLVLSSFAVTAFASGSDIEVENDEEVIESTQYWSLSEPTKVSDGVYSVDVSLTTNYVTGAISFRIDSANGATLTDAVINDEVITYNYNRAFNADGVVAIVPEPAYDTDEGIEVNGVIATVTFTLAADTEGDTLKLVNDRKTAENPGGDLVAVRLSNNNLTTGTMIYGQRVINASEEDIADGEVIASVNIGKVAAAPVLKSLLTGVVDEGKKYVYGVPALTEDLKTYFTVENGSFEMVANATGYSNGTGATLVVKDNNGNEFATYTLIIFGDVNGDAEVTATDANAVANASLGGTIDGEAYLFAADSNADTEITATDANTVANASLGGTISVNPYAA